MNTLADVLIRGYTRHETIISVLVFLAGFVWDALTLTRIDKFSDTAIIGGYLFASMVGVLLLALLDERGAEYQHRPRVLASLVFLVQFSFGALFSAFFIYYFQSAAVATSWPFLLLLFGLLVGNEVFDERYTHMELRLSTFFLLLYLCAVTYVPIVLGHIGTSVFLWSGVVAVTLLALVVFGISRLAPTGYRASRRRIIGLALAIVLLMNGSYFFRIIPPIPLSLRAVGVAQGIERTPGVYTALREVRPWWQRIPGVPFTVHTSPGSALYLYSTIFAPTDFTTPIVHEWQYYRQNTHSWETRASIAFPVSGGREKGYRGYSEKGVVEAGKWRVRILTEQGQELGRVSFTVETSAVAVPLQRINF